MNRGYWGKRSCMIYELEPIVRDVAGIPFADRCGLSHTSFIKTFNWIEDLGALDVRAPHL